MTHLGLFPKPHQVGPLALHCHEPTDGGVKLVLSVVVFLDEWWEFYELFHGVDEAHQGYSDAAREVG